MKKHLHFGQITSEKVSELSRFLEAPLVRQVDGELKDTNEYISFCLWNISIFENGSLLLINWDNVSKVHSYA